MKSALEAQSRAWDRDSLLLVLNRRQTRTVNHKVKVIGGARDEGVSFARIDDGYVTRLQLDGSLLDPQGRVSGRDKVDLGNALVEVRVVDPRSGVTDSDWQGRIPGSRLPSLGTIARDPLNPHAG